MKHQEELISALNSLGALLQTNARYEDARQTYDRAISVSEQLLRDHPDVVSIANGLVPRTTIAVGMPAKPLPAVFGSGPSRHFHTTKSAAIWSAWHAKTRMPPHSRLIWLLCTATLPIASSTPADRKKRWSCFRMPRDSQKLAEASESFWGTDGSWYAYVTMADVYRRFPKQFDDWFERAVESYSKGREILERLAPDNATNLVLTRNLARTYLAMARVYRMRNDLADALLWIDAASNCGSSGSRSIQEMLMHMPTSAAGTMSGAASSSWPTATTRPRKLTNGPLMSHGRPSRWPRRPNASATSSATTKPASPVS